jgi:hypothetical protein
MCGRVRLSSDVSEIKLVFSIPPHRPTPNFAPSWNAAPTDPLPIVRFDARAGTSSMASRPPFILNFIVDSFSLRPPAGDFRDASVVPTDTAGILLFFQYLRERISRD